MYFYHYFSKETGPFHSISELPEEEAKKIWNNMIDHLEKMSGIDFKRNDDIMIVHRHEVRPFYPWKHIDSPFEVCIISVINGK